MSKQLGQLQPGTTDFSHPGLIAQLDGARAEMWATGGKQHGTIKAQGGKLMVNWDNGQSVEFASVADRVSFEVDASKPAANPSWGPAQQAAFLNALPLETALAIAPACCPDLELPSVEEYRAQNGGTSQPSADRIQELRATMAGVQGKPRSAATEQAPDGQTAPPASNHTANTPTEARKADLAATMKSAQRTGQTMCRPA